ncbi:MAG: hypothetical protein ACK5UE_08650 [Chitinophagales bacterium]|nr:hypothetical protein [Sphingobacteriales bacterium]
MKRTNILVRITKGEKNPIIKASKSLNLLLPKITKAKIIGNRKNIILEEMNMDTVKTKPRLKKLATVSFL